MRARKPPVPKGGTGVKVRRKVADLQRHDAQHNGEDHAGNGEHPHPQEVGLDVILDVHIGKAGAQQGGGNHGADEGGAVAADHHGNRDGQSGNAEALADGDDDGQHTVEVGVGVEGQSQRHGQDADDQRQMLTDGSGQNGGDQTSQAAHHAGHIGGGGALGGGGNQTDDVAGVIQLVVEAGGQHAHEDGGAHQGGAHHEGGACVEVDDLLVHLGGGAVVNKQSNGHTQHKGHVAGEHVPDQHDDDGAVAETLAEDELCHREHGYHQNNEGDAAEKVDYEA